MPSQTPTLEDVIADAISTRLDSVYTALPGRITSYDGASRRASVQPLIKHQYINEIGDLVSESLPLLPSVQVVTASGGGHTLAFPVKAGDVAMLIFASADMDQFRVARGEGQVTPTTRRKHSLNDAVAIVGLSGGTSDTNPDDTTVLYTPRFMIGGNTSTQRSVRGDAFKTAFNTLIGALQDAIASVIGPAEALALANAILAFEVAWDSYLTDRVLVP